MGLTPKRQADLYKSPITPDNERAQIPEGEQGTLLRQMIEGDASSDWMVKFDQKFVVCQVCTEGEIPDGDEDMATCSKCRGRFEMQIFRMPRANLKKVTPRRRLATNPLIERFIRESIRCQTS